MAAAFELQGGALKLRIRLTPNARDEAIGGLYRDAAGQAWLKASVRAVPEDGRANAALLALLAKSTGIAKGRFQIVSGHAARAKTVLVAVEGDRESEAVRLLAGG